jgi:hypothetical protein
MDSLAHKMEGGLSNMCIIIVKPKGNELTKETLEICFDNNDDGAGFMWFDSDRGLVVGDKGYMKFAALWAGLERKGFTEGDVLTKERGVVLHCRIATHGSVQPALTHPFPLTEEEPLLRSLNWEYEWGMVHNGTIPGVSDWNNKNESDTFAFVRDYLSDEKVLSLINHEPFVNILTFNLKASNKFAIFTPDGDLVLIGSFVKGQDGNIYSNSSFQQKITRYSVNRWGYQGYNVGARGPVTYRLTKSVGKLLTECTTQDEDCASCECYVYTSTAPIATAHYCSIYKTYLTTSTSKE